MTLVRRFTLFCAPLAAILFGMFAAAPANAVTSIERDPTFGGDGTVAIEWEKSDELRLAVDGSGRIYAGASQNLVYRFKPSGAIDTSWGKEGVSPYRTRGDFNYPGEVDLLPGGGLLMPSMTDSWNYEVFDHGFEMIKLGTDGRPDLRFGKRGLIGYRAWARTKTATATDTRRDGKIYLTGGVDNLEGRAARARLMLLRPDGSTVERFGHKGAFRLGAGGRGFGRLDNMLTEFTDVVALPDGGALVTGVMGNRLIVTRVSSNGRQIRSFGGDGLLAVHYGGWSGIGSASYFGFDAEMKMHPSPDGKWFYLLAQGGGGRAKVIAFDRRGRLKRGFGDGGVASFGRRRGEDWRFIATALEVLPGGRLVVAGGTWQKDHEPGVMTLLNRDGTVEETFGDDGYLNAKDSGLKWIIDIERDGRGGLIVTGDPISYTEPPPGDEYEPGDPTYGWLSRFVVR